MQPPDEIPSFLDITSQNPEYSHIAELLSSLETIEIWISYQFRTALKPWVACARARYQFLLIAELFETETAFCTMEMARRHLRTNEFHDIMLNMLCKREGIDSRQTFLLPPCNYHWIHFRALRMLGEYLSLVPITKYSPHAYVDTNYWGDNAPDDESPVRWRHFFKLLEVYNIRIDDLVSMAATIILAASQKDRFHQKFARDYILNFFIDPQDPRASHRHIHSRTVKLKCDEERALVFGKVRKNTRPVLWIDRIVTFRQLHTNFETAISVYNKLFPHAPVAEELREMMLPVEAVELDCSKHTLCSEGIIYYMDEWPSFTSPDCMDVFIAEMSKTLDQAIVDIWRERHRPHKK
jgi:hypothetical protein